MSPRGTRAGDRAPQERAFRGRRDPREHTGAARQQHEHAGVRPIHRSFPRLTLNFDYLTGSNAVDQRFAKAIQTLSMILTHSFRLNNFPELKIESGGTCTLLAHGSLEQPIRRRRLDLDSGRRELSNIRHRHGPEGKNSDAYMEALFGFMTTSPESGLDEEFASEYQASAPNKISIGLDFSHYKLAPEYLLRIRELLDRVYRGVPKRQ